MLVTEDHQKALLNKYINDKHTLDESIGFIDGMNAILDMLKYKETDKEIKSTKNK